MINVFDVKPGTRLELIDGRSAVVTENMEDGMWLTIAIGEDAGADETELCHAQDIKQVVAS